MIIELHKKDHWSKNTDRGGQSLACKVQINNICGFSMYLIKINLYLIISHK